MLLSKSHLSSTSYFSEQGREQKVETFYFLFFFFETF